MEDPQKVPGKILLPAVLVESAKKQSAKIILLFSQQTSTSHFVLIFLSFNSTKGSL